VSEEELDNARDEVELAEARLEIRKAELGEVEAKIMIAQRAVDRLNKLGGAAAVSQQVVEEAHDKVRLLQAEHQTKRALLSEAAVRLRQAKRRLERLEKLKSRPATEKPGAPAAALFEERSWDFGAVERGKTLVHSFRMTNPTDRPVQVESVRSSCGCLTVVPTKVRLDPGQAKNIDVHVDTSRLIGHKTMTVYVLFSEPWAGEVRLQVDADSRAPAGN
jgi:hypothetical protein